VLPVPLDLMVVDDNSPEAPANLRTTRRKHSNPLLHRPERTLGRAYSRLQMALEHDYEFHFRNGRRLSHNPDDIPNIPGTRMMPIWCSFRLCNGIASSICVTPVSLLSKCRREFT